jgi:antitoxin CptB
MRRAQEVMMSGTARSSEGLDHRRRRLLFRSWHRGIREMDLILGGFADREIATLTDGEMDQYEHLLEVQDADILSWVTGTSPTPALFDTPLLKKIVASRVT